MMMLAIIYRYLRTTACGRLVVVVGLVSLATLWVCRREPSYGTLSPYRAGLFHHQSKNLKDVDLSAPDAPFISWPLARVCRETAIWVPGLVFVCDNNSGGIGNIRSFILTCLRYAIEAGATGLILPQIETRSESNLAELFRGSRPFDYFFDTEHFHLALSDTCPNIKIYNEISSVPGLVNVRAEMITPKHYGLRGGCDQRDLNRHTDLFGPRFRSWLADTASQFDREPSSAAHPRLIRFNWGVQWEWPIWKDGPEFANSFGAVLRFHQDILSLGVRTARAMREFSGAGTRNAAEFLGVHLRTEHDALKGWPNFENQTVAYLHEGVSRGFRAAYLATGNETDAARFKARALAESDLRVVTKRELLEDQTDYMLLLQSLSWDQQALIDYIVLLEADYFVGVSPSSFSMSVAFKRHLKDDGLYTRPWRIGREGNGRSSLVGKYEKYWQDWLFMYDSLWP